MGEALAYFVTFRTYGTWLHGDERGAVNRNHNLRGAERVGENSRQEEIERGRMVDSKFLLSVEGRAVVAGAIQSVCAQRQWEILGMAVLSNHVHVVVSARGVEVEKAMNDFKVWATRRLRQEKWAGSDTKVWARHGSTRYLFNEEGVLAAVKYVKGQGL